MEGDDGHDFPQGGHHGRDRRQSSDDPHRRTRFSSATRAVKTSLWSASSRAGDLLAKKLAEEIKEIEGVDVPLGSLDISFYRDDYATNFAPAIHATNIPFSVDGKRVVLVDDILYTGRTIRAALDAVMDLGRPSRIELAVLVDRGHRELPISPDFVGKNVPSSHEENVHLYMKEVDGHTAVEINDVAPGSHVGSAPLGGE